MGSSEAQRSSAGKPNEARLVEAANVGSGQRAGLTIARRRAKRDDEAKPLR
jgi:hypothetical protein